MSLASVRALTFFPAGLLLLQPAFGQQGGSSPKPATPVAQTNPATPNPSPSATPATAPAIAAPVWSPPVSSLPPPSVPKEHPDPVYVSGRVMIDDGRPFADPVVLETVCDGASHAEGFADASGNFGFLLGGPNSATLQDASVESVDDFFSRPNILEEASSSNAPTYITPKYLVLADCQLRASLPGYRSDSISIGNRRELSSSNLGTIVLHRLGAVEGRVVSATSLAAPRSSRAAFEKGLDAVKKNKLDDAQKNFEKAAQTYPGYAAAWYELGKLEAGRGQFDDALRSFQSALRADPKYVDPYLSVSAIQTVKKQWPLLAESTRALLDLDPYDYPQAYYMNALANYNLRNVDAAEKSAREAERLDTQGLFPRVWRLLGDILASRHAFTEAAEQMRGYLRFAPQAPDAGAVRAQLSQFEALSAASPTPPR
jgi:tetratricopeptide (TPR) repeat protein